MDDILETERLVLRKLSLTDTSFIIELVNSPGWMKYIGDRDIHTEEDAIAYLVNGPLKSYETYGFGLLMVELQNGRTPIGICGILKRNNLEHPDLGFAFLPDFQRVGYAQEAATGILVHVKNVLKLPAVLAITKSDNARSIQLLEKLQFRRLQEEEGVLRFITDI